MNYHPVFLDLRGRRVVVIGGGRIATAKIRELVAARAEVAVVSPVVTGEIDALVTAGSVTHIRRTYRDGDLDGAWLAIAAVGDPLVHRAVEEEAARRRIWLNSVDDVANCSFIAGSVHRQGDVVVAISTGGACPALAVRLRQLIGRLVGPEHAAFARLARRIRPVAARLVPDPVRRTRFWYRLVDSNVLPLLGQSRRGAAQRVVSRLLAEAEDEDAERPRVEGRVILVGAGPGHPGLITAQGLAWVRIADVIVHDRLVGAELLRERRPDSRLVDVGKPPGGPAPLQEAINAVLIEEARAGNVVVRLKGGDPFVFGRGAEECRALTRAGIRCDVIPGVSSAIAAPAAAGIPVTERGLAAGFAVVTGHEAGTETLDWSALARIPTLVVLMGRERLGDIADRLIAAGRPVETGAAVIADATLPTQRAVHGNLGSIAALADEMGIGAPATLVVGPVAAASCLDHHILTVKRKAGKLEPWPNPAPTSSRALSISSSSRP